VEAQQRLERPLVAELAPQNERLLIKLLRSGRHLPFNHYAARRGEKVQSLRRFSAWWAFDRQGGFVAMLN
jgi:hypothetical protein